MSIFSSVILPKSVPVKSLDSLRNPDEKNGYSDSLSLGCLQCAFCSQFRLLRSLLSAYSCCLSFKVETSFYTREVCLYCQFSHKKSLVSCQMKTNPNVSFKWSLPELLSRVIARKDLVICPKQCWLCWIRTWIHNVNCVELKLEHTVNCVELKLECITSIVLN